MSLNFGQISSLTMELAALELLKNIVSPGFLCNFYSDLFNIADNQNWHNILSVWIYSWSLFQVQCYLPLSILNYGVSKHYAGSQVSDHWPLGYLFMEANNMNPDQTAPKEQSDLGPYYLQYRLPKDRQTKDADDKSLDWGNKGFFLCFL